jgi:hypothetical protein
LTFINIILNDFLINYKVYLIGIVILFKFVFPRIVLDRLVPDGASGELYARARFPVFVFAFPFHLASIIHHQRNNPSPMWYGF